VAIPCSEESISRNAHLRYHTARGFAKLSSGLFPVSLRFLELMRKKLLKKNGCVVVAASLLCSSVAGWLFAVQVAYYQSSVFVSQISIPTDIQCNMHYLLYFRAGLVEHDRKDNTRQASYCYCVSDGISNIRQRYSGMNSTIGATQEACIPRS
jgi:hypothetical protein